MNRNPVIPYVLIMVVGIVLVVFLSIKGLGDSKQLSKPQSSTQQTQTATTASAQPEEIYKQTCIGCHGDQYQGVVGPSLHGVGKKYTVQQIETFITKGKGGKMPPGLVPASEAPAMAKWVSQIK